VAGQAVGIISTVGALLIALLSILVMAFLLTVRRTFTADLVNTLIPPDYRCRWIAIMSRMGERMGGWVIGQIIITAYYGVAFSAGLSILRVPDPISIGVITGVLEIIPFVGGFLGLLLAAVVALSVSPFRVLWVVVLYLIVTNVEAHILVPYVYGRAVHVHPFLVVVALLIGAETFGILGAIVAVPIATALQVVVENLYVKEVVEAAEQSRERSRKPVVDVTRWFRDRRQRGRQAG
jgi:predicted PurR-regulated permease PerM